MASAKFENEVLALATILTPPMSSNTMSSKDRDQKKDNKQPAQEEKKAGR